MEFVYYIIFPGFLFASVVGLLTHWVDRKVTALVQYRVGPPMLQGFYDFFKLAAKEVTIPTNAKKTGFLLAPLVSLAASTLVATILGVYNLKITGGFVGDFIVLWYIMTIPSTMLVLGAASAGNPLASVGASREMKMILGYELPFLIAIAVPIFKVGSISLTEILSWQAANGPTLYSLSGVIAFIVTLLCIQAKLGLVPFDAAEAETELGGGAYYEYSGIALGSFILSKEIMHYALPIFMITVFWGGINYESMGVPGLGILWAVLKYVLIVALITVIRNTNPRLRIDQAVGFFWGWMFIISAIALVLSLLGL